MERLTGFSQRNGLSYIEGYAEYLPAEVQMQLILAVVDKCRQYEDAEAEGRLLLVPAEVYQADAERIYPSRIRRVIYETDSGFAFDDRAIGETVFLSREEAEAALRKEGAE